MTLMSLSFQGNPVSIGASYFYVQSFEQSSHLRTSPWEDLGNSFSFWASADDKHQKVNHRFESVINPEEYGIYLTGFTEKWLSDPIKIRTQMDFIYDRQKHISNDYDSIRVASYIMFTF